MLRESFLSRSWTALAGAAVLTLALTGCDDDDPVTPPDTEPEVETIADVVAADANFSVLLGLLQDAGLVDAVADEDATLTVFAPTNAAFGPYDAEAIAGAPEVAQQVLLHHVLGGVAVTSDQLGDGQRVETLAGDEILVRIVEGQVFIDGSRVTTADVETDNGVIHVIDRVLVGNQNLATVVSVINQTQSLFGVVVDAGLGDAFAGADDWTVFAPNNAAFAAAAEVLAGLDPEQVVEILQYHVLPSGIVNSTDLLGLLDAQGGEVSVPTAQGEDVVITQENGQIVFNGGQATLDVANLDYYASNGIIHLIDGILLPEAYRPVTTIADVVAESADFSTLLAALQAADLVGALADAEATFTVFAPNDDAFGPINVGALLDNGEALTEVLTYHVVPGQAIASGALEEGDNVVTTLAGQELTVTLTAEGEVFVEGSQVTTADVETDNGVIHVIDRTLLGNQNLANVVAFTAETEELLGVVAAAGLAEAFVEAEGWTVFGPNNATFQAADLSGFSEEQIVAILQYHVFAEGVVASGGLLGLLAEGDGEITIPTAQGEDLTIAQTDEGIVFNGGQATLDLTNLDYFASNGILHVIDGILLPPSFVD
ncbi:MAG: hypothetical protein EA422_15235 [Gemmatimonadales bacterium]|nr:MAG: hypothetical protein EA422_15235 [Gemmatimonadales bacterium]